MEKTDEVKRQEDCESFGMTDFCNMIHSTEKGRISCTSTWK